MKDLSTFNKIIAIIAIVSAAVLPFYVTIMAIRAESSVYGCILAFLICCMFSATCIAMVISSFKDLK